MSDLIEKARLLASERHAHLHLYNAARSPAIMHIAEVAAYVEQHGGSENMIAAAWLHDIVEDTDITLANVEESFGAAIASLVSGLTDPPDFEAMPLAQRKSMQAEKLKTENQEVKCIKLCDQLSNVLRILNDPPTDWDENKQYEYITGAKKIAEVCYGVCPPLDALFDEAYKEACIKYRNVK